jgi:hypothetical protein
MTQHGVVRLEDGTYEFYWIGNRLSMEEFNEQTLRVAKSLKDEVDAIAQGMSIGVLCREGKEASSELRALQKVCTLPLCDACKKLIGCDEAPPV